MWIFDFISTLWTSNLCMRIMHRKLRLGDAKSSFICQSILFPALCMFTSLSCESTEKLRENATHQRHKIPLGDPTVRAGHCAFTQTRAPMALQWNFRVVLAEHNKKCHLREKKKIVEVLRNESTPTTCPLGQPGTAAEGVTIYPALQPNTTAEGVTTAPGICRILLLIESLHNLMAVIWHAFAYHSISMSSTITEAVTTYP